MRTKQEYQDALDKLWESEKKFCNEYGCFTPKSEFELLQELIDNLKENEDEKIDR